MIEIDPAFKAWLRGHQLSSWSRLAALVDTAHASRGSEVRVRRLTLGTGAGAPGDVFFKLYLHRTPSWKYLARHSKAACEFRNYRTFQQLGIPSPQPVAIGEKRDAIGRLQSAFIITQAVPDAVTLGDYFDRPELSRQSLAARQRRLALLALLAGQVRTLHEHGFYHFDLVWRNLLVSGPGAGDPQVFWIDCPRGAFCQVRFLQDRKALRDLGAFDKSASRHCTAGERLHFFRHYFDGQGRWTPEVKRGARKVLDYWRTRWPEDWPESG